MEIVLGVADSKLSLMDKMSCIWANLALIAMFMVMGIYEGFLSLQYHINCSMSL